MLHWAPHFGNLLSQFASRVLHSHLYSAAQDFWGGSTRSWSCSFVILEKQFHDLPHWELALCFSGQTSFDQLICSVPQPDSGPLRFQIQETWCGFGDRCLHLLVTHLQHWVYRSLPNLLCFFLLKLAALHQPDAFKSSDSDSYPLKPTSHVSVFKFQCCGQKLRSFACPAPYSNRHFTFFVRYKSVSTHQPHLSRSRWIVYCRRPYFYNPRPSYACLH